MRLFTNKRIRDIFLQVAEGNVTQSSLAQEMNVSTRTIRNDLKEIEVVITSYGSSLISDRKKGISIQINNQSGFEKLLSLSKSPWNETRTAVERRRALASALLSEHKGISLEELESKWFISIYSLRNDIALLKRHFAIYEIKIISSGCEKFVLEGSETSLRRCLYDHLLSSKNSEDEYQCLFTPLKSIPEIKKGINQYFSQHGIVFSDVNLRFFSLICGVASERIRKGLWLFDFSYSECEPAWKKFSYDILHFLLEDTIPALPDSEVDFMSMNLAAFCSAISDKIQEVSVYNTEQSIMNHFLSYVSTSWFCEVNYEETSLRNLLNHIKAMRIRVNNNISIINPLLEQIKRHYPLMFEMTLAAFSELEHFFIKKITDDEIGYLVMHIGAMLDAPDAGNKKRKTSVLIVSDQGNITSRVVYQKISKMYSEIQISKAISVEQYNSLTEIEEDVVISLAPISEKNTRVISLPPLPDRWQLENIKYHLAKESPLSETILSYFSKEHFFIFRGEEHRKEDIIIKLSEHLECKGRVDKNYLNSVIEREARSSTLLDDKIAIPHPMGLVALSTMVTVAIFPDGIEWDAGKKIKIVFMLAISENAFVDSMIIYDYLTNILDNDVIEKLSQSESFAEFISLSRKYFL